MSNQVVQNRPLQMQPLRMQSLARLPIFLALEGKRVLLAGNADAAAWKAELLSAAGARVDIFASDPGEELRAVAAQLRSKLELGRLPISRAPRSLSADSMTRLRRNGSQAPPAVPASWSM